MPGSINTVTKMKTNAARRDAEPADPVMDDGFGMRRLNFAEGGGEFCRTARPRASPGRIPVAAAILLAGAIALLLGGCGSHPRRADQAPKRYAARAEALPDVDTAAANNVLMRALSLVGTPYVYGGNTPAGGFDCSGLVGFVYADAADVRLPRTTAAIAGLGAARVVDPARLRAGDLIVFGGKGGPNHVGIVVGDGRFVHAPSTGGTVRMDARDSPYWRDRFRYGLRILTANRR